jgi:hypothetical protein
MSVERISYQLGKLEENLKGLKAIAFNKQRDASQRVSDVYKMTKENTEILKTIILISRTFVFALKSPALILSLCPQTRPCPAPSFSSPKPQFPLFRLKSTYKLLETGKEPPE